MEPVTPEKLQFVSNLAHWIEGTIFAMVAIIAFLRALGYVRWKGAQYLWPSLIVMAGLFLPAYILLQGALNPAGDSWSFIVNDAQQREHFLMAALLVLAGTAEITAEAKMVQSRILKLVTPAALVGIGIVLLLHTEYGTQEAIAESVTNHRYQGSLVILVGIAKAAEALWQRNVRWLAYPWIILLIITAALLISYREPPGAYRTESESNRRSTFPRNVVIGS